MNAAMLVNEFTHENAIGFIVGGTCLGPIGLPMQHVSQMQNVVNVPPLRSWNLGKPPQFRPQQGAAKRTGHETLAAALHQMPCPLDIGSVKAKFTLAPCDAGGQVSLKVAADQVFRPSVTNLVRPGQATRKLDQPVVKERQTRFHAVGRRSAVVISQEVAQLFPAYFLALEAAE